LIVVFVEEDMYGWGSARNGYGELRTINASALMLRARAWLLRSTVPTDLNLAAAAQMVNVHAHGHHA
jgi:CRISPR/Cas system CSM-associated protein Csm3 (group 7 of RAMP superfamily)